ETSHWRGSIGALSLEACVPVLSLMALASGESAAGQSFFPYTYPSAYLLPADVQRCASVSRGRRQAVVTRLAMGL
ncbi:MAG: hypothetical protein KDI09_12725, partial [Halioglobus sp.]|nr:hypothetical protein [Halioglobus sp.]